MSTVNQPMYEWKDLPWKIIERQVFKLQKRIYQAAKRDHRVEVHKLQRLLVKSWFGRCLAVRRVTQDNQGKKTAGVDGVKQLTPKQRLQLVSELKRPAKPKPVRRVWIPKPGKAEKRPLGIPTMQDRAHQALVKLALEPEWEARFEPNSYGFRPGRSCHDAIEAIFANLKYVPRYVLDADIKGCFDNINQETLLEKLQTFPALRRAIKKWLKAGVLEDSNLHPTESGTPQGGVISPLLANIALHGLEERIRQSFPATKVVDGVKKHIYRPKVIRYADDFVILHEELAVIQQCKEIAKEWLAEMGLELKESKTRITHTLQRHEGEAGFDFLGFNVQQFPVGKNHYGSKGGAATRGTDGKVRFKTIIKPSKKAVKRHYRAIADIIGSHNSIKQEVLIRLLNPKIRGWCNYYSTAVSKMTFNKLDHLVCQRLFRWGMRRHSHHKGRRWVADRYFNTSRNKGSLRPWDFIAGDSSTLHRYADTRITRHVMVNMKKSPYDGDFVYWARRVGKHPEVPTRVARLLQRQQGRCFECGLYFKFGDYMEVDHIVPRELGGRDAYYNWQLLHRHCHDNKTRRDGLGFASTSDNGQAVEEPYEDERLTYGFEDELLGRPSSLV